LVGLSISPFNFTNISLQASSGAAGFRTPVQTISLYSIYTASEILSQFRQYVVFEIKKIENLIGSIIKQPKFEANQCDFPQLINSTMHFHFSDNAKLYFCLITRQTQVDVILGEVR